MNLEIFVNWSKNRWELPCNIRWLMKLINSKYVGSFIFEISYFYWWDMFKNSICKFIDILFNITSIDMYLIVILSIIIDWSIVIQGIDRVLFNFSKNQKSWTKFRNFVFIDFSRTLFLIFKTLYFKFINFLERNASSVFFGRSLHFIFLFDFVRASTP